MFGPDREDATYYAGHSAAVGPVPVGALLAVPDRGPDPDRATDGVVQLPVFHLRAGRRHRSTVSAAVEER